MKKFHLILILCSFTLMACPQKIVQKDQFYSFEKGEEGAKKKLGEWMDGKVFEPSPSEQCFTHSGICDLAAANLLTEAEVAYWEGETLTAFDYYAALLRHHPESALTRIAAWRINSIRSAVPSYTEKMTDLISVLDFSRLPLLSKSSLMFAVQTAALRAWKTSDSDEPFDASSVGFPSTWKTTPRMSPWRLRDFDESFSPEKQTSLDDTYRSPAIAADDPKNVQETNVYRSSGISLYPKLGKSGLYYLETFAEVDQDTEFLLYGNFAAASVLWIDGEEVFRRTEKDYTTGKRYRRIKLKKGTHRLLVKMAYQNGYRDWFDLAFIPMEGRPDRTPVRFAVACMQSRTIPGCIDAPTKLAGVKLQTDAARPIALEPVLATGDNVEKANDLTLYLTMLAANLDAEPDVFADAWRELRTRRPQFAAGHAVESDQIETLWQIPSRLRSANSRKALRRASELAPDNIRFSVALGNALGDNASVEEMRGFLRPAYSRAIERGLVHDTALETAWPKYLASKLWEADAEVAYEALLKKDQKLCDVGIKLYNLRASRDEFVDPATFGAWSNQCHALQRAWTIRHRSGHPDRVKWAEREWRRYPLSDSRLSEYANELTHAGRDDEALKFVEEGLRRSPSSANFWSNKVERAVAKGDLKQAHALLDNYEKEHGLQAWIVWKRSALDGVAPLQDLMPDGLAVAKDAVDRSKNNEALTTDDAYYVMDFAARRYFEDGSHLTLTHTVARVMTKAAIDRYAEQNVPNNARLLLIRTIKKDGSTREPETTAGKQTLSMPGLAEGDFVETAYLQFSPASDPASAINGVKFYFRMDDISTLHSEYIIIGENATILSENGAPKKEMFQYDNTPAIRFVAKDNPRPRNERGAVPSDEYLPWIQMYRLPYQIDDFEASRRFQYERIQDALKSSPLLERELPQFFSREDVGSEAFIKDAFYSVASRIAEPSMSGFDQEITHSLLLNEGNPSLVLKALFDQVGVANELYIVRSAFARPTPLPVGDFANYGTVLLRVEPKSGDPVWLYPNGPDAMYLAFNGSLRGQKAVCISCRTSVEHTVSDTQDPIDRSETAVSSKLSETGDLTGRIDVTVHGATAVSIRRGLRARPDETSRSKFVDSLVAATIPGASVTAHKVIGEANPDGPLKFEMEFSRPKYATATGAGIFQIETRVFHQSLASAFASLPQRSLPLLLGFRSNDRYRFTMELPFDRIEVASPQGERKFDGPFGTVTRTLKLEGKTLAIGLDLDLPIQRVSPEQYGEFQKWAVNVEQSSSLLVQMK